MYGMAYYNSARYIIYTAYYLQKQIDLNGILAYYAVCTVGLGDMSKISYR